MAEKSIDEQIADLNAQIKKLEDEKFKLEHPTQEYPKWVMDPKNASKGRIVKNKEEEDALAKGNGAGEEVPTFDKTAKELDAENADLGEEEHDDAEAAGAHGTARVRNQNKDTAKSRYQPEKPRIPLRTGPPAKSPARPNPAKGKGR